LKKKEVCAELLREPLLTFNYRHKIVAARSAPSAFLIKHARRSDPLLLD
jgi:hypothetical protein